MTDLLLLAERVEDAEGFDPDLDHAIHDLLGDNDGAPAYTLSLDAALTLVPEGCGWTGGSGRAFHIWKYTHTAVSEYGNAATPALALTAACLRARSTMEGLS